MERVAGLQAILREYDQAVQELQKKRRMLDGLLGMGNHPGNDACHELLDRRIEALCREAAEAGAPEEATALAEAILRAEGNWQGPEYARLMLVAVQRHTLSLIPLLPPDEKKRLAAWYEKQYPRRKRLPVQGQVLKALQ